MLTQRPSHKSGIQCIQKVAHKTCMDKAHALSPDHRQIVLSVDDNNTIKRWVTTFCVVDNGDNTAGNNRPHSARALTKLPRAVFWLNRIGKAGLDQCDTLHTDGQMCWSQFVVDLMFLGIGRYCQQNNNLIRRLSPIKHVILCRANGRC